MIEDHLSEEDIIWKYYNDWHGISSHQYLTEEFIIKHQDKLYWYHVCKYQNLSENFIIEFQNKLDWSIISLVQNLSLKFIIENISKLDIRWILKNEHISEEIKQDLKMYLEIF